MFKFVGFLERRIIVSRYHHLLHPRVMLVKNQNMNDKVVDGFHDHTAQFMLIATKNGEIYVIFRWGLDQVARIILGLHG